MGTKRTDPKSPNPPPPPNPQVRYQIRQSFLLALVPLFCGLLLLLLLYVFAKLNLFYLEASGLPLDGQVQHSYFVQVQLEFIRAVGYLLIELVVTFTVGFIVMRWANAPFAGAYRMIEQAMHNPEPPRTSSRLLSESPRFDRVIINFCQRLRGLETDIPREFDSFFFINFRFLLKFLLATGALSLLTGYVTQFIFDRTYLHIVDLGLELVQNTKGMPHYFIAQKEIVNHAAILLAGISFLAFAAIGVQISRYMATMIFVFSRSVQDDRFPILLRGNDCYRDLSSLLNEARKKIS